MPKSIVLQMEGGTKRNVNPRRTDHCPIKGELLVPLMEAGALA